MSWSVYSNIFWIPNYIIDNDQDTSVSIGFSDIDSIVCRTLGIPRVTFSNSGNVILANDLVVSGSSQLGPISQSELNLLAGRTYIPNIIGTDNYVPLFNGTNNLDVSNVSQSEIQLLNGMTAVQTGTTDNSTLVTKGYVDDKAGAVTCYAMHVTPTNTNAGGSAVGWNTRPLNVLNTTGLTSGNSCPFATLSSNQVSLVAGTYDIEAMSVTYSSMGHQLQIVNISDGVGYFGVGGYNGGSSATPTYAYASITIASTKVFMLYHYFEKAQSSSGLGLGLGLISGYDLVWGFMKIIKK